MKNSWKADFALVLIVIYTFGCLVLPATSHARVQIRKETVFGEPGQSPFGYVIDHDTTPDISDPSGATQNESSAQGGLGFWMSYSGNFLIHLINILF